MKTSTIPSLRVDPELRQAAEDVLREGETLSRFVEQSVRDQVAYRQMQRDFIARGLACREEAKHTGTYFDADMVHAELQAMLGKSKAARGGR
ncbi:MAG: YlcI/YnfO family protein [Rhodanobacter sp.]